ncbi:MAG: dTDP-glucose 4,6-dehydratase, partial [Candidatus Omnitrophota bacterium]|nr:dTDP-glucose 4,6-dehydratase [Candidatus Omnitrophota bacterium]
IPNIELTSKVLKLLHKSEEMIQYVTDRLGHDRCYSLDSTKITKLGWTPEKDFNIALRETVDWYKSNDKWWKSKK